MVQQKQEQTSTTQDGNRLNFLPDAQPFGDLEVDIAWVYSPGGSTKR